ncbi:MAG: alpha/beta hydrolase [Erysipelotrichaceae bacterium]|nr:alpha/beta hydrolase [Erysipelotrichaceae bacterium]
MKVIEYGKENKEVIVLLHGGGLSWWNYRREAELLSDRYHIVLPVLDGHAESDENFCGISENAQRIIGYIDSEFFGKVKVIGGLSLGAQILVEILSQRKDICEYAIIESPSLIPSKLTNSLIESSVSSSYSLIEKKWFAKMQFKSLHINEEYFDDYYRDTQLISKENMIAFLKANTAYELKESIKDCSALIRIIAGGKEQSSIHRSVKLLHEMLPESVLEIKEGLYHGEYSLNHPEEYVEDLLLMINGK